MAIGTRLRRFERRPGHALPSPGAQPVPAAGSDAAQGRARRRRGWLRGLNHRRVRALLAVPLLLLGGLAVWLGIADGFSSPVSLSAQVLGLSYLAVGVAALGAAVALLDTSFATWSHAALVGGVMGSYIGLSLAIRIRHHSAGWFAALSVLGLVSLGLAIVGAYAIRRSGGLGRPVKAVAGTASIVLAASNLWYTMIYQPEASAIGIDVTASVGTPYVDRGGTELVPVSLTIRNDSASAVVLLDSKAELTPAYYTPPPGGAPGLSQAHSRSFDLKTFVHAPFYLQPDASSTYSKVVPLFAAKAETFELIAYYVYAKASQLGFDALTYDKDRTAMVERLGWAGGHHSCDARGAQVYLLHQSHLQTFTRGRQALVTFSCPARPVLRARVVADSPGAIRSPGAAAPKITYGSRVQTFLAHGSGASG
jgi:hypothetical protein